MDIWPQDLGSESTFGKFLKLTFRGGVAAVVQRLVRDTSWPNINNWRILIQASEDVSWTSDPTPVYQLWPINSITTVWSDRRSLSKFLKHISGSSNISRRRCAPLLFASLTNSLSESVCWGVRVSRFGVAQCHTLSKCHSRWSDGRSRGVTEWLWRTDGSSGVGASQLPQRVTEALGDLSSSPTVTHTAWVIALRWRAAAICAMTNSTQCCGTLHKILCRIRCKICVQCKILHLHLLCRHWQGCDQLPSPSLPFVSQ